MFTDLCSTAHCFKIGQHQEDAFLRAEPFARRLRQGALTPCPASAGTPRPSKSATKRVLLALMITLGVAAWASHASADMPKEIKEVLVQHNGRVKTFEAFSRQTLRLVAGKEKWRKREAAEVLWSVALDRSEAGKLEWIRLDLPELKSRVGVTDAERHFFTLNELAHSFPEVMRLAQSAKAKRDADERPSALEQKAEQLLGRMHTVNALVTGELFTVVPPAAKDKTTVWFSAFDPGHAGAAPFMSLLKTCSEGAATDACSEALGRWNAAVRAVSAEAARAKVGLELFYLSFHPFLWAWILYLASFLTLLLRGTHTPFLRKGVCVPLGLGLVVGGWAFHSLGLVLRTVILDRPPVSNMYESMIFMNWALMLFAFGFAAIRKTAAPLGAAALVSALIEIYANLLPIDPSMDVLVPVLRSNYWLTVHVLTVVASYGAFGLALALGHRHLIFERILKRWTPQESDASARLILRVIEFGVILIGTGTVLGGIWANESWGRFWGWDPKETWALITLLGYLALIHLRYFKKIGPFGLAVGTIIGFQLVLFTWYGVNFVLGRGLHSYGSGSGGMQWILYYLAGQSLFLVWTLSRRK